MARSGLYKSDVQRARDRLRATGTHPSVDAVRVALGNTGSKTTIHRYLRELEEEEGQSVGAKMGVSDALQDLIARLAERLHAEADTERELPGVGGQVARHLLCGRRQMTTPLDLEMAGRRGVSALGVGSGGGFQVLPNADHRLLQSPDGLGCNGPRASLAEKSGLGGIIQHYPA